MSSKLVEEWRDLNKEDSRNWSFVVKAGNDLAAALEDAEKEMGRAEYRESEARLELGLEIKALREKLERLERVELGRDPDNLEYMALESPEADYAVKAMEAEKRESKRLRAEVESLEGEGRLAAIALDAETRHAELMRAKLDKAVQGLEDYGEHEPQCQVLSELDTPHVCTCGLDDTLAQISDGEEKSVAELSDSFGGCTMVLGQIHERKEKTDG